MVVFIWKERVNLLYLTVKESIHDNNELEQHIRSLLIQRIRTIAVHDFVFIIDKMTKTAVGKIYTQSLKEDKKKIEEYHKQLEENNHDEVISEFSISIAKLCE